MANERTLFVILASLALCVISEKLYPPTMKKSRNQKYKCVDFYKQPAFRDPSLKLQVVPNLEKLQQQKTPRGFGLKNARCPIGTVPILDRRSKPTVNHFIRPPPTHLPPSRDCSARLQTVVGDQEKIFLGATASIDLYKPGNVEDHATSSARIKLVNEADSIEAGWMVNPHFFEDNEAHLYGRFTAGVKGCISMDCPGFMQVSTDIPLGIIPHAYSAIGGQKFSWNISIFKNVEDGNWWLSITGDQHLIGYWPKDLFLGSLKDHANQVEFGGEVTAQRAAPDGIVMGNGLGGRDRRSAGISLPTVRLGNFMDDSPTRDTEYFSNCDPIFSVKSFAYRDDPNLGNVVHYGGPDSEFVAMD